MTYKIALRPNCNLLTTVFAPCSKPNRSALPRKAIFAAFGCDEVQFLREHQT
jgi:hypothetical protein